MLLKRIGVAKPTSISIETFGTAKVPMMEIEKFVNENFDFCAACPTNSEANI
jgi:S-adenosylmethionine synthetase